MADSIFITNTELSVNETAGTVYESISRTGSLVGDVTVTYGITGDTATAGQDFIGGTGTITIPSGVSEVSVPIQILNDTLSEPTETFGFAVINADNGTVWAPRTSRVSILDDENPAPPPNPEPPVVSNYDVKEVTLVRDLDQPVRMVFSPLNPSQVYVAEKPGIIAISNLTTGTTTTMLDLSSQVNDYGDRGLLDIALHPDFVHNPYIYAFMVVDPAGTAGQSGAAGPDGIGNRYSQVVRYTADASTNYTTIVPGSGVVLLGGAGQSLGDISGGGAQDFTDPAYSSAPASDRYINPDAATPPTVINGFKQDYLKVDSSTHAGGHLSFGPDGALYVSVGDGSSFNYADPRTPDVQSLDSLSGKILRVDPMTGAGLPDNPFVTPDVALTSDRAKVFQLGLRNPFSVTFAQDGRMFIADTGWNSWEEIDTGGPGADFGWPWYEGGDNGSLPAPTYRDWPSATDFYNAVAAGTIKITAPFRAFSHDSAAPGFQVQAITAGEAIYTGNVYPSSLQNDFIFADFPGGKVYIANINDSSDVEYLYTPGGFFPPIDFVQSTDGYIYYTDLVYGTLGRLDISTATTPVAAPLNTTIGSGPDNLVLKISQDAYLGDAQYTITVDGVQIGGTLTASARQGTGLDDTVTVQGSWTAGNHTLVVNFLNDAWGGTADTDRNLYVDGVTFDGVAVSGGTAVMLGSGPRNFGFTGSGTTPAGTTIGSGSDQLVLKISQDAYLGDAQYTISVDGTQIGATLTASSLHGSGLDDTVTVRGDWGAANHTLVVNFLNDAWGGTADTDRNLYVDGVTFDGAAVPNGTATLLGTGPHSFGFMGAGTTPGGTTIGSGPNSLVLKISEDAYLGNAQYTVSVDGVQIGGTLSATALHGSGSDDTLTVQGSWATGDHTLSVNFLNDAWGGSADTDRNLYVDGVIVDGTAIPNGTAALLWTGSKSFGFTSGGGTGSSSGSATVTIAPDDANPNVNESNVNIVATAGDHMLFIGGSFDTATLTGGIEEVSAFQGHNSITTGAANDTIRIAGSANVVDAGSGSNHIEDSGSGNSIIMPGPAHGLDDIFGYVLQNSDVLDFRPALAATGWDGSQATVGNFLHVTMSGADAVISMSATAGGTFSNVAVLHGSGDVDLQGLLAHSTI